MSNYETFTLDDNANYVFKNYSANNIIGGDTDSIFVTMEGVFDPDTPTEDKIKLSDELGEIVNNSYKDFCMSVFNAPEDRSSIIQTEREVFGDKGYFASKKRYMIHLIDEEGMEVDKYKIKGLEIIKSDTNEHLRALLKELVLMMINGSSKSDINDRVEEFKSWWMKGSIIDIGDPTSVNTLSKYQKQFSETNDFKGIPQNAKASILYNLNAGVNDPKIRSGDKIKLCYVLNERSNVIAIPSDIDRPPSFLYNMTLDRQTQWTKKAKKKIDNYLKPVGMDFHGVRKQIADSIFTIA